MAASKTTFAQRMDKIHSGKTTSWTVPGSGLATHSDEQSFLRKSGMKMRTRSTQVRRNPLKLVLALVAGAGSVIAARWLDFTYLDTALTLASERGVDAAATLGGVPTALALAVMISILAMFILGLRSKRTVPLQAAGFIGALVFEADLVKLAPEVYARFYPEAWVVDMMASATLLT
ncbi:hypothetical protein [Thalassorhabdomicrobium marinisediminis]|uniref:Uncharacterized protein n=1 Tax=Thalassorhabdomicrobium marinisediminis TaxID=2170577 RepID=A0A2T7G1F2_9RHOB|nr:hypothetical protein [Thalassorhabdomicrobium marinisediminis]PVA08263.1 hypothetical protein DC363_01865 [Thalassorhabdomicrobium marinisediminis]